MHLPIAEELSFWTLVWVIYNCKLRNEKKFIQVRAQWIFIAGI